jgi:hypothetical protein
MKWVKYFQSFLAFLLLLDYDRAFSECEIMDILTAYLQRLTFLQEIFFYAALFGSCFSVIQTLLLLFGMHHDEASEGGDESSFKWLSKQGITGFVMLFGWAGLTASMEFKLSSFLSISSALCAGIFALFTAGSIFKWAKKLRSPGSVFNIEEAVGKTAVVYQKIPVGGSGKISISLSGLSYEMEARSTEQQEIPSFTPVKVIYTHDLRTVVVQPLR